MNHPHDVLTEFYHLVKDATSTRSATAVALRYSESLIKSGDRAAREELNILQRDVSVEKVGTQVCLGLLRSTSRIRTKLPHWNLLRDKVYENLSATLSHDEIQRKMVDLF